MQVLFINYAGVGGTKNVLTEDQTIAVWNRMGVTQPSQLVMCYNAKKHGYSSTNMHNNCAGKGPFFHLSRRNSNGRVFGGYMDVSLDRSGWKRGNDGKSWLWHVKPDTKQVEFHSNAHGRDYKMYMSNSYHFYWGAGPDMYCNRGLTYCRSNMGDSYDCNGRGNRCTSTLSGSRTWNPREGGSRGMVWEVYYVKK